MFRVYVYLCYNVSLKEGVNIKIINIFNVLKKLSAGRLILLLVAFIFLLSLGTLGLYKKYSKPEAEIGVNSEVKGEIIENNENKDTQDKALDTPTTATKPNNNQFAKQPPSSSSVPVTETPVTPPEGSWTNSHGTFKYNDLGKVVPMYLGKDMQVTLGWTTSDRCKDGAAITIRQGTKIYSLYSQVSNYVHTPENDQYYPNPRRKGDFIFDMREYYQSYSSSCSLQYFEQAFSDDPNSPYYPGNLGVWW